MAGSAAARRRRRADGKQLDIWLPPAPKARPASEPAGKATLLRVLAGELVLAERVRSTLGTPRMAIAAGMVNGSLDRVRTDRVARVFGGPAEGPRSACDGPVATRGRRAATPRCGGARR